MKAIILFYILATIGFALAVSIVSKIKRIEVHHLDGMCRRRQVPMRVNYYGIKNEGNILYLNITTKVSEDIFGTSRVVAQIHKCDSKENLDTCQFYREFKVNYCQMLDITSMTPLYVRYTPELKCPFKKGVYQAINAKIDLSSLMFMPIMSDKVYCRIKADIIGENERLLMCIDGEGYSVPNQKN